MHNCDGCVSVDGESESGAEAYIPYRHQRRMIYLRVKWLPSAKKIWSGQSNRDESTHFLPFPLKNFWNRKIKKNYTIVYTDIAGHNLSRNSCKCCSLKVFDSNFWYRVDNRRVKIFCKRSYRVIIFCNLGLKFGSYKTNNKYLLKSRVMLNNSSIVLLSSWN